MNPGGPKTYGSGSGCDSGSGTLVHLHLSSKIKRNKDVTYSGNQGFSYYFCLMTEGFADGSVLVTNVYGSGSERPKNMWILQILINNAAVHVLWIRS
jgi:hypothetical protein